jgi:hypothetical protein
LLVPDSLNVINGAVVFIYKSPVKVPPARGSLVAIEFVRVVFKAASLFKAVAISPSVSNVDGAELTRFDTAVST